MDRWVRLDHLDPAEKQEILVSLDHQAKMDLKDLLVPMVMQVLEVPLDQRVLLEILVQKVKLDLWDLPENLDHLVLLEHQVPLDPSDPVAPQVHPDQVDHLALEDLMVPLVLPEIAAYQDLLDP